MTLKRGKFNISEGVGVYSRSGKSSSIISSKKKENEPNDKTQHRNAMGEYLVPESGKPLTSLGVPGPGPADYSPRIDLTKSAPPHYSIGGKYKSKQNSNELPGPADYTTTGNLIWNNRKSTLKGRNKSYFDEEAGKTCTVIGPAKYHIFNDTVGENGPKYSMAHKQSSDVYTGPPNSIVQPVDTHGYSAPGPNYRPNSRYWGRGHKKSFGPSWKLPRVDGPGPADYGVQPPRPGGPSYSFGSKLPPPPSVQRTVNKESPAANTYDLGTTIGKATSVTISGRRVEIDKGILGGPSPAAYCLKSLIGDDSKPKTMAYRWFDMEEPVHPGPADYTISQSNLKKYPVYSHRQRTKPSFPESLRYVRKDEPEMPGPGNYNLSRKFVENDSPAYSIAQKLDNGENFNPAPNLYESEKKNKPGARVAPSFSMGKRINYLNSNINPGPAAYHPKIAEVGPKFTLIGRPKSRKRTNNPAPNSYNIRKKDYKTDANGVTLKSRPSPYVYSGFRSTKLIDTDIAV